jgi:hypothetical protein
VYLSEVARSIKGKDEKLIDPERALSVQLGAEDSTLDALADGWLDVVTPVAKRLSFIAVDATEHAKRYGRAFEYLGIVRDASDPLKRLVPGYWSVQIDAVDELHRIVPLVSQVFSTLAPEFKSWWDTFLRLMLKVIERVAPLRQFPSRRASRPHDSGSRARWQSGHLGSQSMSCRAMASRMVAKESA